MEDRRLPLVLQSGRSSDHRTQQPQWSTKGLLTYYNYTDAAFVVQDVQSREVVRFPSKRASRGSGCQGDRYVFPEIYSNEISDPTLLALKTSPLRGCWSTI